MRRKAIQYPNDSATNEWLSTQKDSTKITYSRYWRHFLTFVKLTGDEILADRRNDKDYRWEKKVLAAKVWAIEKGLAQNSAKSVTTAARSFFAYHREALQFRKTETRRLTEAHVLREDFRFSLPDLKKLFDVADLTEKYVLTAGKSFGLRAGDFLKLTRGDIEPYIDRETPIGLGALNTQKEGVKAYPFVDSDAQPVIKLMLEKMSREGRTQASDRILVFSDEIQLTRVLKRLAQKGGINIGGKIVRFHCLRKFLSDHLSSHMSSDKWKQIIGKTLSESAYVSPDSLREDYARAMSETCFNRALDEQAKAAARAEFDKIFTPEQKEFIQKHGGIRFHRKKAKQEKEKECTDGEHCQRVASEAELPDLLAQGWHASIVLPSGKIVLER